ncbi:MAG: hypothetical protein ABIA04_06115 [Pseudomonadota bacterium]
MKIKLKYQQPVLCNMQMNAYNLCYSVGSGASTDPSSCDLGSGIADVFNCRNGSGDSSGCGAGNSPFNNCGTGSVPPPSGEFDPDGCLSGTGNPGCGTGNSHLDCISGSGF